MPSNPSNRTSWGSTTASWHARTRRSVSPKARSTVARLLAGAGRDPLEHVKFHFDPRCPWCYQTSRWARRLEELGEIELEWGVFSLEVVNLKEGMDRREFDARSGPALRTAVTIRDSLGAKAIGPFYAALGRRVW